MKTDAKIVLNQQLLKAAFIIGPALLVLSALSFVAGIGLIPPGITSYVEGIFGSFALIFFVPIYLYLGNELWNYKRVLGSIATITGLLGSVVGFGMEFMRVTEYALRQHGATDEVFASFYHNPGGVYLSVALAGPLFPLTSVLLGAGFLRAKAYPAWVCMLLMTAGVFFPIAQVLELEWALKITYPLACLFWLVVCSWIAMRRIGEVDNAQPQLAVR